MIDNGNSHCGKASVRRLTEAHPTLVPVHLPIHASWLNQVEIYFSVLQRKVLTPADAVSLDELAARIIAFQRNRFPASHLLRRRVGDLRTSPFHDHTTHLDSSTPLPDT